MKSPFLLMVFMCRALVQFEFEIKFTLVCQDGQVST